MSRASWPAPPPLAPSRRRVPDPPIDRLGIDTHHGRAHRGVMSTPLSPDEARNYAQCAAHFWANKLREHAAPSLTQRAGHTQLTSALAVTMMFLDHQSNPPPEETAVGRFEVELASVIAARLMQYPSLTLDVDYDPCDELRTALMCAGFRDKFGVLPFKTTMWITEDGVEVRDGYGCPRIPLVQTKRDALRVVVAGRLNDMSPYGKDRRSTEEEYILYYARRTRLGTLFASAPPTPVGEFDLLVEQAFWFVSDLSNQVTPWPLLPSPDVNPS